MNANQLRAVFDFETSLRPGAAVLIRWTCGGCYHAGRATITKVNKKSVRARLEEPVPTGLGEPYAAGREIIAPTVEAFKLWSYNNRVEPVDGYPPVE